MPTHSYEVGVTVRSNQKVGVSYK